MMSHVDTKGHVTRGNLQAISKKEKAFTFFFFFYNVHKFSMGDGKTFEKWLKMCHQSDFVACSALGSLLVAWKTSLLWHYPKGIFSWCCVTDLWFPFRLWYTGCLDIYEKYHSTKWRQSALDECLDHIKADDEFTQCISIGPVSLIYIIKISMIFWVGFFLSWKQIIFQYLSTFLSVQPEVKCFSKCFFTIESWCRFLTKRVYCL